MQVSNNYVAVERVFEPEPEEGQFQTAKIQDDSIFKGKVKFVPEAPIHLGNSQIAPGDIILFAKYSPDTHEVEHEGDILKFINVRDILARLEETK